MTYEENHRCHSGHRTDIRAGRDGHGGGDRGLHRVRRFRVGDGGGDCDCTHPHNRGFTNFGIALDYDREQLELLSIQTAEGETPYLCGTTVAVNTQWTGTDEKTFGYVTAALEEAATADGILFTATFRVSGDFSGTAAVQPVVQYMRSNKRLLSVFDAIPVTTVSGTVSTVLVGDYDQNGTVNALDVMGLYRAVISGTDFSEEDLDRLDVNRDGMIKALDIMAIYGIVSGGQE